MAFHAAAASSLILIRGFRSEGYSNLGCAFPPLWSRCTKGAVQAQVTARS